MSDKLSRRGFLGGTLGATVVGACAPGLPKEKSKSPLPPETELVQLRTKINGSAITTTVHHDESAVELIREKLLLTGSKISCGHGACGACAILVDGAPVAACLLPATALEGKTVQTIEGLSKPLHPVQQAFMVKDALQCGFCTPGFIVESISFYNEWRAANTAKRPSRDEVAAALAGHLCRCGAYPAIYEAVQDACEGLFEADGREAILAKKTPNKHQRFDAKEKVTGAAKYTVDIHYKGQLEGRILRSPYARAKVKKIDWSEALKIPGVKGVVRMLVESGNIRYPGQEIVAVAAINRKIADEAVAAIKVEYEVKTPLLDSKEARKKEAAPVYLVRRERKKVPNANEGPLLPEPWEENNLRGPLALLSYKDRAARDAIEDAKTKGHLATGVYTTQHQSHTNLEPRATVAYWEGEEKLTVHMSTQAVGRVAGDIAERFELAPENVTLLAQYVGGGFGAKTTIGQEALAAIELAKLTGAPVRVSLDRGEEILLGARPESEVNISIATDELGNATGISAITYSNAGVAVGTLVSALLRLIYPKIPKELVDYDVVTNAPPGLPFRASGGPPAAFALEQCIDELAQKCKEDPISLRRRWDPNPNRNKLYDWIETIPEWKDRAKTPDKGRYRKGVGFASASWFCFVQPDSQLQLDAAPSGFTARTSTQDPGNGSRTTIAVSLADTLGIEPKDINIKIGDSRFVEGPITAGSRTTGSIAPTAVDAAKKMIDELLDFAQDQLKLTDTSWEKGGVKHSKGFLPWKELLRSVSHITVIGKRKRDEGGYLLPFKLDITDTSMHSALAAGVQLSEILLDTRLGKIQVTKVWGGYAVGKIVIPTLAKSQIRGGIIQTIGQTLYEERRLDPKQGLHLTHNLEDYHIPGIGDVPEMEVFFCEDGFEKVTGRSVGLSELVMVPGPASIANAVASLTGWRPKQLPLRPERVLEAFTSGKAT